MKFNFIKTNALILILFFTFTSCVKEIYYQNGGKTIKGNKESTIENREIDKNFQEIKKSGFTDLIITDKIQAGNISLEGESNLLEYVETEVKNSTLYIGFKKNTSIRAHQDIVLKVNPKNLTALNSAGSGDISTERKIKAKDFKINQTGSSDLNLNLETENLHIKMAGSGDVKLAGKSTTMEVNKTGSGDIYAYDFSVKQAKINSTGSGDAEINVAEDLQISNTGSGDIYYKGNPDKIKVSSTGSGDIVEK